MAIKDLVAPGFVGTSSIKFIVTRGVLGAPALVGTGAWRFENEDFSVPKFVIEDMSVSKFTTESLKRS
ncbi:hypothetical protein N9842_03050 [Porticoccaceae bacterium]|nr:hypothetical protein [Porticoccaceae bacterium]